MKRWITPVLAVSIAAPAHATDWRFVSSTDEVASFADRDSAQAVSGGEVELWDYQIWFQPADGMTATKSRLRFRCSDRSYRSLVVIMYATDGTSETWTAPADDNDRSEVYPDTPAAQLLELACGNFEGTSLGNMTPEQYAASLADRN